MSSAQMFVLIGELKGDYDDFYQRYRDVLAVSTDKQALEEFRDSSDQEGYVEYAIEEVPVISKERRPSGKGTPWGEVTQ